MVIAHHGITSSSRVRERLARRWTELQQLLQKLAELKNELEGLCILGNVLDIFPFVFLINTKVF